MTSQPHKHRVLAWDALRAFAIVSVVGIHVLMIYRETAPPGSTVLLIDDLLHYAVPLFVFISGALVWSKPLGHEKGAYRTFLARRGAAIVLPFLAWDALYLVLFLARATDPVAQLPNAPSLLLTGNAWYHLYFVPMLLTYYLLTPLAQRVQRFSPELLVVACYAVRVLWAADIAGLAGSVGGDLWRSYVFHVATHLPHMALGAWFALRSPGWPAGVRRAWPVLLAGGFAVLASASYRTLMEAITVPELARLAFSAGMAAVVLGLVLLAFTLEPLFERHRHTVTAAGALAFGVYFVHPLFVLATTSAVAAAGAERLWTRWWFTLAVFAAITAASFGVSWLLARQRHTAWLVGLHPPRPAAEPATEPAATTAAR